LSLFQFRKLSEIHAGLELRFGARSIAWKIVRIFVLLRLSLVFISEFLFPAFLTLPGLAILGCAREGKLDHFLPTIIVSPWPAIILIDLLLHAGPPLNLLPGPYSLLGALIAQLPKGSHLIVLELRP
jgi:hypothetical protein